MDVNGINVFYDIEYNSYKKKLMRDIFIQVDTIFNIFDKGFNDNMIKLFILFKKEKVKNDYMKYLVFSLYDFIIELNNLEHIDQNEFLNLILKFIKIYTTLLLVNFDIKVGKIDQEVIQYINWEIINNKIVGCINEMKQTNKIIEGFIDLNNLNYENQIDVDDVKKLVSKIAGFLAYDFFMYYSSTEIHRISHEKALNEGIDLNYVLLEFNKIINSADYLVAHNLEFDFKVLSAEFIRKKITHQMRNKKTICTMKSATNYCAIKNNYGYKWPTLQELHFKLFNEKFINAHNALEDVLITYKCFVELSKKNIITYK